MKRTILLFVLALASLPSLFAFSDGPAVADTLIVDIDAVTDVSCFGNSDGAIQLSVQGTPPFVFEWSNGGTTQNVSNLPAGIYDVIVEDSTGVQIAIDGIEIKQPDELTLSLSSITHPGCNGIPGALWVQATGGTPDYAFEWSSGQTENSIDNLAAGDYEVSVTDATGCSATMTISLQPQFPVVSLESGGNITCVQSVVLLDGSASDAGINFTFQWTADNGGNFASATDTLVTTADEAGTYTLEITDLTNGCVSSSSVEIVVDTLVPVVDAGQDTTAACTNAEVILSGSASLGNNFGYLWTAEDGGHIASGATTETPTVHHAGTYILSATNLDNGCAAADTVLVLGTNEPPVATVSGGEITCLLTEAQLIAEADTTDKVFNWAGPDGFTSDELDPFASAAGEYIFTITDTLTTCTSHFSAEILDNTGAPALVVFGGTITCASQTVVLTAMTSSPDATFDWTGPNGFSSNEQNPEVTEAGDYLLVLTDTISGCSASETVIVESNTATPVADAGPDAEITCAALVIQLDGTASSQGDHFTYAWTTAGGNILSGAETLSPEVDAAGTYILTVTDTDNGCASTASVSVISNAVVPTVEAFGGTVTCFEPELQLLGVFDTLNVTFGWEGPNGFTSFEQNPIVTISGDYVLTVTDTLTGCSATATATLEKDGIDPELTATGGTIDCNNSTVQLTVEAQIGDIIWSWSGDNGFESLEQNPVVTEPGMYTVLAIDTVFGCIALDSVLVEIDTLSPVADAGQGLSFNCHILNAYLDGSGSSQGANFSYLWTTTDGNIAEGETTLAPFVDVPGTYTLTVSNTVSGCTAVSEVVVSQIAPVTAAATFENVACYNTGTGSATVTPGGGDGNFSYAWSSGSLQATATGLVAGSYTATVTDGQGCTATSNVTISQPDVLTANASGTGQSLAGVDDGTATAEPAGGTAPYAYDWSNGGTDQTLTGLAPGAYTVTVTDANGCTAIATANVNEFPCVLTASIAGTDAGCFGAATGSAEVTLQNETQPVAYAWSNGDTLSTATGLAAGIYTVVVTDSTNCSNLLTVMIGQPVEIVVSELFHVDVTCPDEVIGFVIVGVNGGVQPYQFDWSNGSTSNIANGLGVGEYNLAVTDGTGCVQNYTTSIITTDAIPPVVATQSVVVFLDENGTASVTADQFDAGSSDNCGIASIGVDTESFDCTHLGDQTVTITVTDLNGNESTGTATVTVADDLAPVLTCPDNLTVSACNTTVEFELPEIADNCAIDLAQLELTAGLASGSVFPLGVTTQTFVYTDAAGNTGECSFEITLVEQLEGSFTVNSASCASLCDGSISVSLSGGVQPYNIFWSNGETGETISGLCAGMYSASVTDAGGCETSMDIEITEPAPLELVVLNIENPVCESDLTGAILADAAGGTAPYSFAWSNGETTGGITGIAAGTYELTGTDANGCSLSLTIEVTATDSEAPVLALQNATVSLGANGSVTLDPALFDAGSTDNCGIANWTVSPASFGCADLGGHTVNLTATDGNGNAVSGTATVTVVDNIAPVLTCPANVVAGFCNLTVTFVAPQVQDNCAVNPANLQLTAGLPSGSIFPAGITTQTYSYTDASGNAATCSFTVSVFNAATVTAVANNITCASECDGSIELNLAGGAAPFAVLWSNGQTGTSATGLCAGTYSATITDAAGCLQSFTTTVIAPSVLNLMVDQVINDLGGAGVGSIQISVSGGTAPYSYVWTRNGQPFATIEDITNLQAGQYTVAVTDANGCDVSSMTIVVENITGTKEAEWSNGLSLTPNPAADWVRLTIENPLAEAMEVQLFDATGKMARRFNLANGENVKVLDLTGIQAGIYSVQLRSAGSFAVRRLVISK
jgi:hypothetical protein